MSKKRHILFCNFVRLKNLAELETQKIYIFIITNFKGPFVKIDDFLNKFQLIEINEGN